MSHTQTKFAQNISAHAAARYWRATLARDSRADGSFVLAVRSTHIYCRPSCPARRPLRRNVTFFRTREEAEKRSEEHTSELQSRGHLVCRLLLEKKKNKRTYNNEHSEEYARQ